MHSVPQIRSCPFLRDTFDIVIRVRACLQFDSSRETKCRSLRTMCVERCVPHSFAMIRFSSHKPIENGVFNFFFESNTRLFRHICAVLDQPVHITDVDGSNPSRDPDLLSISTRIRSVYSKRVVLGRFLIHYCLSELSTSSWLIISFAGISH